MQTTQALFLDREVWTSLSQKQRNDILALWPDPPVRSGPDMLRPDLDKLRSNDDFRNDVTRYQDELRGGQHETQWIAQAIGANQERAAGVYDPYLAAAFASAWGEEMPASGSPAPAAQADGSLDARSAPGAEDVPEAAADIAAPEPSASSAPADATSADVASAGGTGSDASAAKPAAQSDPELGES